MSGKLDELLHDAFSQPAAAEGGKRGQVFGVEEAVQLPEIQQSGEFAIVQHHVRAEERVVVGIVALFRQWAAFFRENHFLVGLSLDGMKDTHDLYRLDALGQLKKLFRQAGRDTALEEAGDTLEDFSRGLSGATRELYQVVRELAGQPVITLEPVSGALREKGDALDDALSGLLDQGEALGDILTQSADLLLDDWNAINDQLGVITGLLREELQEPRETALEDRFQDRSDQADLSQTSGRISGCRNTGAVEGDVNVAGVAGSMALEYDFDPEDDLVREGDRSLDFQYQTKAVVFSCVNQGTVTGKKDYAGGVVGRMDLGMVSGCGGYGPVESTGGSYVGGIAGASWGTCGYGGTLGPGGGGS